MINIEQNTSVPLMTEFYALVVGKYNTDLTGVYETRQRLNNG
jgi:hypothetical protein